MKGSFSVIKFVPDAVRFEPINVGIVVELGDRLVTTMAQEIDPRIRLADPYADVGSLKEFLRDFNAERYVSSKEAASGGRLGALRARGLPNLFFAAPTPVEVEPAGLDFLIKGLFERLVARSFSRPHEMARGTGVTAAKSALREAFRAAGVFNKRVESQVPVIGLSGVTWIVDFRFATAKSIHLVEAATTSLSEDIRSKEHGFEAFATLIDVTRRREVAQDDVQTPPSTGVLAVDARPEDSELSAQLARMAQGHGLDYVAGQLAFFDLARRVQRLAIPVNSLSDKQGDPQLLLGSD